MANIQWHCANGLFHNSKGMASTAGFVFVIAGACLAVFLYGLRARWFSRLERGFLVTISLAIAGFAFLGALVSGVWQYQAGRQIVHQEIVKGLGSAGEIVQANLAEMINIETEELSRYGGYLPDKLSSAKQKELAGDLRYMDELNQEILQIEAFDRHGMLLSSSNVTTAPEQVDHTAVGLALDGKRYVSDAYFSAASHRYVLVMGAPIQDAHGTVAGAIVIRYDLQRELSSLIGATRFEEDGYGVITNNAGRVLAHPDSGKLGEDFSSYAAVEEGRQGKSGWITSRNSAGKQRLFVYRPLRSPATLNPQSWVLLTESDEAKAMAPGACPWLSAADRHCALYDTGTAHCPAGCRLDFASGPRSGGVRQNRGGRGPHGPGCGRWGGRNRAPGHSAQPDGEGSG